MKFTIYQEGFMIQGMDYPAKADYVGSAEGETFIEACKIFRPNVPFTCLCGLNAIGGKALINKDKFILNEKGFVTDLTALDGGIFCEV